MSHVIMIVGCPASGKGTLSKSYIDQGYVTLNRDTEGGRTLDLIPKMEQLLKADKNIILDNTFPTITVRKPFIELAKKHKASIECLVMGTSIEDAQINCLIRMWDRYGKFFLTQESLKEVKHDPNMFPSHVLFHYRKEYQKPKTDEGFDSVQTVPFKRKPRGYSNKAIILDYDGTLRESTGEQPYPTKVSEVKILPGRTEVLKQKIKEGYILLGVSNQSGITKGILSEQAAVDCFDHTNKMLGVDIKYHFCSHRVPPMTCYCRKPQSGLGVVLIEQYKLDPTQCIFVGDMTTDKSFATRLGFQYQDHTLFFK